MNKIFTYFSSFFRFGGSALSEVSGNQPLGPSSQLNDGTRSIGFDAAMQISTVWRCAELLAKTISTLPIMVYANQANGMRSLARDTQLWAVLHNTPNTRMTPSEFWCAMVLNLVFRGNAYARLERDSQGRVFSIWPMPADQVEPLLLEDGSMVYTYRIKTDIAVLAAENVLHIKEMGNGTVGMPRLDYMRASTNEAANAQGYANSMFKSNGKPTGLLMIDHVLNSEQRKAVTNNFAGMAEGNSSRLYVLEADMKYQQISMSAEDMQLLSTRQFNVEELCRWFGVPPVLIGHSNVTTWGSGVEQIVEGFYKLTIRPCLVSIEQAIAKRVLTSAERARFTVEYNFDALLRASIKDRMEIYAKAVQNGIKTRNECRQLENDPPVSGGDTLTAQSNLVPLDMLGKIKPTGGSNGTQDTVAQ